MDSLDLLACLFAFASILTLRTWLAGKKAPLPPGPAGLPILGSLFQISPDRTWIQFTEWSRQWGEMISVSIFMKPIIILSSARAVDSLFERPAYSGRPSFVMAGELCGFDVSAALMQPGPKLNRQRKLFHRVMGSRSNVEKHGGNVLLEQTRVFLLRLLNSPDGFAKHIRFAAAAAILQFSYGYTVQHEDDPVIALNDDVGAEFGRVAPPGAVLVDILHFLKYIPEWMPGAAFKREAKKYKKLIRDLRSIPFERVKAEMKTGTAARSFVSTCLEESDGTPEDDISIKDSAGDMYGAGVDTSSGTTNNFFLAMTLFPEVQRRAQAELDSVLGRDFHRLPTFKDREQLPYFNAVLQEVYRWQPLLPLSIPHRLCEDDIFDGYLLPKNATVIMNSWAILHDETLYADPWTFNPDRFMGNVPERDPRDFAFGYGRRICPGRLFGDTTVFVLCASALAVFDIKRPKGDGKKATKEEISMIVEPSSGLLSHPKPYGCMIVPRSSAAESLVRSDE